MKSKKNNYINNFHQIDDYLEFLRFCLDGRKTIPKAVARIDWHDLLQFAIEQSIVGVFFDGIERIGNVPNKPSDENVMEWYGYVRNIEERGKYMFEKSSTVVKNFCLEGFRSCVLKGQGNALLYPNQLRRQSGDIDIWLEGDIARIVAYVKQLCPNSKACYHHIDFTRMKGVEIEVHYRPSFMNNPFHNRRLQNYFQTEANRQFSNLVELPNNMGQLCVPTLSFNRIFQMSHISNHFFHEGIGLRQLIDYYYLLRQGFREDERQQDIKTLKQCGLLKIARAVMYVLHTVLGLEEDFLLVEPDERRGRYLLHEILHGGNFGHHDKRIGHNAKAGGVVKNIQRLYRDCRTMMLFPSESLWEPFFRIYHFFWRRGHR